MNEQKLLERITVNPKILGGKPITEELRAAGHDVVWVGDWPDDPGDELILETAHIGGCLLITLDKDLVNSSSSPDASMLGSFASSTCPRRSLVDCELPRWMPMARIRCSTTR